MDYDLYCDHHHHNYITGDEMTTNVIITGLQRDPTGPGTLASIRRCLETPGDTINLSLSATHYINESLIYNVLPLPTLYRQIYTFA